MKITVKLFGKPIDLDIEPENTISDVKAKIKQRENINVEVQRLVYCRKPLDDDSRTLDQYRIAPNTTIYLMLRLHVNTRKY